MRKIFVFWIIFLIILIAGIILTIYSKSVLRREERRAEKLKESIISEPSRSLEMPTAGEKAKEEVTPEPVLPSQAEIPPLQDIPVQINTNSLEISIPAPQPEEPLQEESQPVGQ